MLARVRDIITSITGTWENCRSLMTHPQSRLLQRLGLTVNVPEGSQPLDLPQQGMPDIRKAIGYLRSLTPIAGLTNIIVSAEVAQSVEHSAENAGVVSSILTLGTARL